MEKENKRNVLEIEYVRNVTGKDIQKRFAEVENLKERKIETMRSGGS